MSLRPFQALLAASLAVLSVLTAADAAESQPRPSQDTVPVIALRLAYADSASERERLTSGDSVVFVARAVLLSDADLISVRPSGGRARGLVLRLTCRPEAAQRLRTALQNHIGDHLAVLIAGRLVGIPYIASPIGCEDVIVGTSLTGDDAAQIRELVRIKWPSQ